MTTVILITIFAGTTTMFACFCYYAGKDAGKEEAYDQMCCLLNMISSIIETENEKETETCSQRQ